MKVLLAGHMVGQGGIQSHLRWLGQMLGESGVETLALSLSCPTDAAEMAHHQAIADKAGIGFVCCANDFQGGIAASAHRLMEMTKIVHKFSPDVYFAIGTGWNLALAPLLARSKAKTYFHEVMSGRPNDWHDPRWGVRFWFNEVAGQSPTVARTFAECFDWQRHIAALPAIPEPLELTAKLPQPTGQNIPVGQAKAALFSRLVPHKQAFWLVQQWEQLKDVLSELHIHGTGDDEPLIREYIELHGLADRVKCFGRYPSGQAYVDLLSQYDMTLLPTIGDEGAPLVLLESMACGIPFVAYGAGGIPDYGNDNPNVIIVSLESKAFVENVRLMADRLSQGDIDQSALQQFYLEHYSYSALKQTWVSYLCQQ